jgi:hypothetical protein
MPSVAPLPLRSCRSTQANGTNSSASTVAAGTLTATAGDIIVACMHAEWISSKSNWDTISGVANTPTPLTWAFRARSTGKNTTGDLSYSNSECWWAYTSAGVTSTVNTATYNNTQGGFDDASIVVFSVKGFTGTAYHTAPFDQKCCAASDWQERERRPAEHERINQQCRHHAIRVCRIV